MSSAKWRPFCLGLNVFMHFIYDGDEIVTKFNIHIQMLVCPALFHAVFPFYKYEYSIDLVLFTSNEWNLCGP